MRTRRGARLTAGGDRDGRAWARVAGETYDPADDPQSVRNLLREDPPAMSANPAAALSPADIAARCRLLGADVSVTPSGEKYRIVPPAGAEGAGEVVHCPVSFRGRADRADILGHLRRNGLDPMNVPDRPEPANAVVSPADIPKLQVNGRRPTLQYAKPEPTAGDCEPEPMPVRDVEDLLELIDEQGRRVAALERGNQSLARRVEALERAGRGEAVESREDRFARISARVQSLLGQMPAAVWLGAGQIMDGAELGEDERAPLRTVLARLVEAGQVQTRGKGSGMVYAAARPKE